jgi:hypothetical protein
VVAEQPDSMREEIVAAMRKRIAGSPTGVWQRFARHDVTFKKDNLRIAEQLWPDVAHARRRRRSEQFVFVLARLLFVDKTGASTNLLRLRGRVIRGEGPVDSVHHGRWKTITLLAGLRHDAVVARFVIDGPLDGKILPMSNDVCLTLPR